MSSTPSIVDLNTLRQSCAGCALHVACLSAALDGEDLVRLDRVVRRRKPLARGEMLFDAGVSLPSLFVVRSGSLKTWSTMPDGDVQVLGFHLPGEIIGFDGLLGEERRSSAEALEHTSVCELPFDRLSEIATTVPGLQQQLYRVMSREFSREQQHPVIMGRKQALSRLALFLHSLSERRRITGYDAMELRLSMSRQELANYLGLVIETVSRLFSRLQTLGAVEVDRKTVRITDLALLQALAHGDEENIAAHG